MSTINTHQTHFPTACTCQFCSHFPLDGKATPEQPEEWLEWTISWDTFPKAHIDMGIGQQPLKISPETSKAEMTVVTAKIVESGYHCGVELDGNAVVEFLGQIKGDMVNFIACQDEAELSWTKFMDRDRYRAID